LEEIKSFMKVNKIEKPLYSSPDAGFLSIGIIYSGMTDFIKETLTPLMTRVSLKDQDKLSITVYNFTNSTLNLDFITEKNFKIDFSNEDLSKDLKLKETLQYSSALDDQVNKGTNYILLIDEDMLACLDWF